MNQPGTPSATATWPDKIRMNAYYDEKDGTCHSIDVFLNYDGITVHDVREVIRTLFQPRSGFPVITHGSGRAGVPDRAVGSTDVIPRVGVNGEPVRFQTSASMAPDETTRYTRHP